MKNPIIETQNKFQTNPVSYFLHPTSYHLFQLQRFDYRSTLSTAPSAPSTALRTLRVYYLLDILIDNILQPLLLAADHFGLAIGHGKIAQVFQLQQTAFKFLSFTTVERSIAVFTEFQVR
jgi:hypothetical protein